MTTHETLPESRISTRWLAVLGKITGAIGVVSRGLYDVLDGPVSQDMRHKIFERYREERDEDLDDRGQMDLLLRIIMDMCPDLKAGQAGGLAQQMLGRLPV